jgi:hypothetical protein
LNHDKIIDSYKYRKKRPHIYFRIDGHEKILHSPGIGSIDRNGCSTDGVVSMGTYRVHCNINGASVYFDDDYKGNIIDNILDVPVLSNMTPYRSFTVEKEGYKSYTGGINTVPAKGQVVNLYSTLSALPVTEYGTIHLVVTPTMPG